MLVRIIEGWLLLASNHRTTHQELLWALMLDLRLDLLFCMAVFQSLTVITTLGCCWNICICGCPACAGGSLHIHAGG